MTKKILSESKISFVKSNSIYVSGYGRLGEITTKDQTNWKVTANS